MPDEELKQKLTAILNADVKDYSRLLSQDRVGTIKTLKEDRKLFSDFVRQYGGRVVDSPGDNILAAFDSVSDTVNCAVEIQSELAERNAKVSSDRMMLWRIGVSLGDITEEENRIYGDGVNIAARVEELAEPGGVSITGTVYDNVKGKLGLDFESLGKQIVKNMQEPIYVYRVGIDTSIAKLPASTTKMRWVDRSIFPAISIIAIAIVASAIIWSVLLSEKREVRVQPTRFVIQVPHGYDTWWGTPELALSPDGKSIVYRSNSQFYLRLLGEFESKLLAGTENAQTPFYSPDSRWIAFTQDESLKKLSLETGSIIEILPGVGASWSGSWGMDNSIIFGPVGNLGLMRVPASGGEVEKITEVDEALHENTHLWPQLLPGNRHLMYTSIGPSGGWSDARIVIENLESKHRKVIIERGMFAKYLPTSHIVYMQVNGVLAAAPFNVKKLEITGSAIPIKAGIMIAIWGGSAAFAVSDTGTLAFVKGALWDRKSLRWVDYTGNSHQVGKPLWGQFVRLSPDSKKIAMTIRSANNDDIYLVDADTEQRQRFTFGPEEDETPVWSPDGSLIAYSSAWVGQARRIYLKPADSSGEPKLIYTHKKHLHLSSWSSDGEWLLFNDLPDNVTWALNVNDTGKLDPIEVIKDADWEAHFSPNGNWIAYSSSETGHSEVYVTSFPDPSIRHQVSTAGGTTPRWIANGQIFYWNDESLMMVNTESSDAFYQDQPVVVYRHLSIHQPESGYVDYDVAADGKQFAILTEQQGAKPTKIHVVLNWFNELERLVPTR